MTPHPTNTPPPSPGISAGEEEDDELILNEDDILEEIDIPDDEVDQNEDDDDMEEDGLRVVVEEQEEVEDNSKLTFSKHGKSVFCVAPHPQLDLVASGGEDDHAYIWQRGSGEVDHVLDKWGDSVNQVAWSSDGGMLAASDMGGQIRVYRVPGFQQIWSFEVGDILWLKWHSVANVLFCGTVDSDMWMWKIPSGDSKIFQGQGEKTECATILPDGKRAMCGYSDGSLRLFDLKTGSALHTISGGLGHKDIVNCLDSHDNNTLVMSGSMDGTASLWNTTSGKSVGTFVCGAKQEENSSSSVESAVFSQERNGSMAVTGTLDGVVTVWDVATQVSRISSKVGSGITKLLVHSAAPLIFASTMDGAVRVVDIRTGAAVAEYGGHTANVLDMGLAGDTLVTSSDDGTCKVFDCSSNSPDI